MHRCTIPTPKTMGLNALIRRIQEDINEAKRRGSTAALKAILAAELEDLVIETLAATKGGLDNFDPEKPLLTLSTDDPCRPTAS